MLLEAFLLICLYPSVLILFRVLQGRLWIHLPVGPRGGDAALGSCPTAPVPSPGPDIQLRDKAAMCLWAGSLRLIRELCKAQLTKHRGNGEDAGAKRMLVARQGLLSSKEQKAVRFCSSLVKRLKCQLSHIIVKYVKVCSQDKPAAGDGEMKPAPAPPRRDGVGRAGGTGTLPLSQPEPVNGDKSLHGSRCVP